ncbi:MAG: Uma2 family endonuclease, partial [Deltaproteobacteria bacterium]|nr:Uma2 family endonuclease [Deltaproteobacteria bacterium]
MEKSTIIDAARYHIQMTPEEFLDWVDEDDSAELIDGEVNVASPASGRHQEIELFLGTILGLFVRRHQLGRVYLSQFMMRLGNNLFVPDVMYLSNKKLTQRLPNYMKGPADMVMEIVSPESIVRDRQRKFSAYQAAGVREYWLFEPETEEISVFRL